MILDSCKQYAPAVDCYLRAHLLDKGSFRWVYYLGWAQASLGHFDEAALTLCRALCLDADYLPARLRLADSLLAKGKLEEVEGAYERITKDHPKCAPAQYGLGRAFVAFGKPSLAADCLEKARALFPS